VLTFSPILVEFVQDGEVSVQLCSVVDDWFRVQSRVSELIHCIYILEFYLVFGRRIILWVVLPPLTPLRTGISPQLIWYVSHPN
jgi:hypothetical protein